MGETGPAAGLIAALRDELRQHLPFAQMPADEVDGLLAQAQQTYHAPGETLLAPADGPVADLFYLRRGAVTGRGAGDAAHGFDIEPGELFPVGAVMGARAVAATYSARLDSFCLRFPVAAVHGLAAHSAPFGEFLQQRALRLLQASRDALRSAWTAQALAEQALERPLADLSVRTPVVAAPDAPLGAALERMHVQRVGSVLAVDGAGAPVGILTRHDVLDRVVLAERPLATPLREVMSVPVHTLGLDATVQDAALLMARAGIRHVPVVDRRGAVVSVVSERDLFALQRLSLRRLGSTLRDAPDVPALVAGAAQIRDLAQQLVAQGLQARPLTQLISHLNDLLTERLVVLQAARHGVDLARMCWLAFGSEGRSEQTIATDQDNGLVFVADDAARDRPAWLAFAREVNDALAACGFPLCSGNVMASNPDCCLTAAEWCERFAHWMAHGAPADLLHASIYFDLRVVAGERALARPLRALLGERAPQLPRFVKQLADNALTREVPLNWHGGIDTRDDAAGRATLDLKLQASAIFVEAARVYALAHGIEATNTSERLAAVGPRLHAEAHESDAWAHAFEFIQLLRLRHQVEHAGAAAAPNRLWLDTLDDLQRRTLKESLRIARRLQQRLRLDYDR